VTFSEVGADVVASGSGTIDLTGLVLSSPAPGLERGQRAGLIGLHQPAVADHIDGEDGGQTALSAPIGHGVQ